ncbi:hypothetical protein DPV79_40110 [Burkholderia reimsis]|uniref:Uncharacterized protein n=1 Tax=Burkholderia reimsis TaxID=2234132 RepID=A0A365QH09_9BURK|nr:hypothetical protein [Burkholderia reimsis]RBB31866.1 hypothetical protein DPV79_40110 [Burkholderia reimsis]
MRLWTSGEIELDVEESSRIAINKIKAAVNQALEGVYFDEKAEKWTFIPIILSEKFISDFPEIAKRSSKGAVLEFRLHLPYEEFKQAGAERQMVMLFDVLSRSVELMTKLKVSHENQEKFRAALAQARKSLLSA